MKKLVVFIIVYFVSLISVYAQQFEWESHLNKVDSDSYYKIFIRPEITSKLNYKFSDIRIYDENNAEVPYIKFSETNKIKTNQLDEMQIIENEHKISKKYTSVIINNASKTEVANLVLIIENTNAETWVNLSGSEDNKTWQILKNNTRYQPDFSDSLEAQIKLTDIPSSNYNYYKILIFDYNTEVIVLSKVYNYKKLKINRNFSEVEKPKFIQDDTSEIGRTVVNITFPTEQYIDKIVFNISKPNYFLRKAEIAKKDSSTGKKIKLEYYDENQKEFNLCSDSCNELFLSKYRAKELFLVIDNNDDVPLLIDDIIAYQENEYFIAFLEKGKKYNLKFGNKNVSQPIYDLKFFQDKIPENLQVVEVSELIQLYDPSKKNQNQMKIQPELLWLAFGVVVIILGLISVVVFKSSFSKRKENRFNNQENYGN